MDITRKVRDGKDAIADTRDACATRQMSKIAAALHPLSVFSTRKL
jgi:hypothetical protein